MIDIYHLNLDAEHLENLPDLTKELQVIARSVKDLARYAEARKRAAEFRLTGKIETANQIEQLMESLYEKLPLELRW